MKSLFIILTMLSSTVFATSGKSLFEALSEKGTRYDIEGVDQVKENQACYFTYEEYGDGNHLKLTYKNGSSYGNLGAYQKDYKKKLFGNEISYLVDSTDNVLGNFISDLFYGGKYTGEYKQKIVVSYTNEYKITNIKVLDLLNSKTLSDCSFNY